MMQAYLSASPTCKGRLKSHHLLTTKICSFESISAFRGGAEEAAAPLFFLVFSKRFCTTPKPSNRSSSVVIIVQSGCSEGFLRGGDWGTRPLLSEFSRSAPEKSDGTRGFHETEGPFVDKEYFTDCLSS